MHRCISQKLDFLFPVLLSTIWDGLSNKLLTNTVLNISPYFVVIYVKFGILTDQKPLLKIEKLAFLSHDEVFYPWSEAMILLFLSD